MTPLTLPHVLWVLLAMAGAAGVLFVIERQQQASRLAARRLSWGAPRDRDRDFISIGRYHGALAGGSAGLDDRTWADLDMDDVFTALDRTESVVGQQLLYARLRAAGGDTQLAAFEHLVTRLQNDVEAREGAARALTRLTDPAAYMLVDLTAPSAIETKPWHIVFPLLGATMLMSIAAIPFWPLAILLVAMGSLASLVLRVTVAPSLRQVTSGFRQVGPLLGAAEGVLPLATAETAPILGRLDADTRALARLRRVASWAGRDSAAAVSGNIAALFFEYLNLLFCLDANALFFGARELRARGHVLLDVITAVGEVDAALSIASYRTGTTAWTRPVLGAADAPLVLTGIRHPLIDEAVANSVTLRPPHGMVITGSNMSGKSTFLRTVGVTAVLAQTINTCLADRYEGPRLKVRSCIGRTDDLMSGKSYYQAEVEAVLSLVTSSQESAPQLLLFDELFRGTNAVERIAGAEAVLLTLLAVHDGRPSPHVVLVATHDLELVDLLDGIYAPFHFTDTIDEHGLAFDYRLLPGPATTRNAIALLQLRGAPSSLVEHALARARDLDEGRRQRTYG